MLTRVQNQDLLKQIFITIRNGPLLSHISALAYKSDGKRESGRNRENPRTSFSLKTLLASSMRLRRSDTTD